MPTGPVGYGFRLSGHSRRMRACCLWATDRPHLADCDLIRVALPQCTEPVRRGDALDSRSASKILSSMSGEPFAQNAQQDFYGCHGWTRDTGAECSDAQDRTVRKVVRAQLGRG
ncbi:hypothetical protein OOU_Y34scaffold00517g5 [Pyricularia oryzae Y34]|uniref:Uncharacterized protein n=2 Tax=Pyricularia oryzae TaxID=318829 RepID=A0AA97NZ44_PYRO3|nr:hypothetical protein OOU_Y34scaffold00517g5 [Pyricularia oryzae Y34]